MTTKEPKTKKVKEEKEMKTEDTKKKEKQAKAPKARKAKKPVDPDYIGPPKPMKTKKIRIPQAYGKVLHRTWNLGCCNCFYYNYCSKDCKSR